ncbi:MAG: hypothetical protein RLZZ221_2758, partial [Verrucomicrobiota bacterium]
MRLALPAALALAVAASAQPALTVYNQGFAVVRERVPLDLRAGETAFAFSGVTGQLEPDSVVLRDPAGRVPVRILEQSYRADVMSQSLLLSLHEGKELEFLVRDQNAKEFRVRGRVIRSGHNPGGQPAAPIVEVDGILRPTLSWRLAAPQAAKVEAELGYVTAGLSWQAAYNLVAPEKGDTLDIVGWISVSNESGKAFENAAVKLMAGDVNRVQPQPPVAMRARGMVMQAMAADAAVTEKAFDEFHLYT